MNDRRRDRSVDEYIDQNLRLVFSNIETAEIPDRFKELLDRLRQQDENQSQHQ
ncbi:NepR family anti-sigma factor [Cognatiyoonia koreensis]|nr:NepR family anti-sigma factor [Cognatiyoonia koreensis]